MYFNYQSHLRDAQFQHEPLKSEVENLDNLRLRCDSDCNDLQIS